MTLTRRRFGLLTAATALVAATPSYAQMGSRLSVPGPLGERTLGADDAPVTIIEYASMTCPHCATYHNETHDAVKEAYVDSGQVRFVFREYPIDAVAMAASMIAHCASGYEPGGDMAAFAALDGEARTRRDGRYFAALDALFERQRQWAFTERPLDALLGMGQQMGLSTEAARACLQDQALFDAINQVKEQGTELGVQSTPSFFVNGELHPGSRDFDGMAELIDAAL